MTRARVRRFTVVCISLLWALLSVGWLFSEEVWHEEGLWGVNIPETWALYDLSDDGTSVSFTDQTSNAFFQNFQLPSSGNIRARATSVFTMLSAKMGDAGEASFRYHNVPAYFAEFTGNFGGSPVRGYLLVISTKGADLVFLAYSFANFFNDFNDLLLSTLDSLALGSPEDTSVGPIGALLTQNEDAGGEPGAQSAQDVVEREARVLSRYQGADTDVQAKAWRRFYQIVYKDSAERSAESLAELLSTPDFSGTGAQFAQQALGYIQNFTYKREPTLSDLTAPFTALKQKTGDCDSRALLLMMMLKSRGIGCILMASSVYSHAMVGIDVPGSGARFDFQGKKWLVAETTTKVAIGQIAQEMSDPANWIGMDLEFYP